MVFLMTDGRARPGGEGARAFQAGEVGVVVGCAVGAGDTATLQKISGESVVRLSGADSSSIAAFFKWVSAFDHRRQPEGRGGPHGGRWPGRPAAASAGDHVVV